MKKIEQNKVLKCASAKHTGDPTVIFRADNKNMCRTLLAKSPLLHDTI
jgi:hypothetical protein